MKPQVDIEVYIQEYTQDDTIAKYISKSAGDGIAYVLQHVYAPVYRRVIRDLIAIRPKGHRFRVMEYGCGGGMNLLRLVELLQQEGALLERGYGLDFSPPMIEAARREAESHVSPELYSKLTFAVAGNENLTDDLSRDLGVKRQDLDGTFDIIIGVNTTRYAHRLHREDELSRDIYNLLRPGGQTVMIDMNRHFPLFRSRLRSSPVAQNSDETYIPSLKEYTRPFKTAGFEIADSRNFCWIPHSANPKLLAACRAAAPVLNLVASPFAMRSLVVGRKSTNSK